MLLGVSPAAVVPMLVGLSELGGGALIGLTLIVVVTSGWRALGARREMRRIEIRLSGLADALGDDPEI